MPIPSKEEAAQRTAAEREELLRVPTPERPWVVFEAFQAGMTVEQVQALTAMDPWFLRQLQSLVTELNEVAAKGSLDKLSDFELARGQHAETFTTATA